MAHLTQLILTTSAVYESPVDGFCKYQDTFLSLLYTNSLNLELESNLIIHHTCK